MSKEFTVEELKKATKNPFYERLNKEVLVAIRHEDYEVFLEVAKQKGDRVRPEDIMRRCLSEFAQILREHD